MFVLLFARPPTMPHTGNTFGALYTIHVGPNKTKQHTDSQMSVRVQVCFHLLVNSDHSTSLSSVRALAKHAYCMASLLPSPPPRTSLANPPSGRYTTHRAHGIREPGVHERELQLRRSLSVVRSRARARSLSCMPIARSPFLALALAHARALSLSHTLRGKSSYSYY